MGAYDRIFGISVIFAVLMIGLSVFMGLYIPTVEASGTDTGGDYVLAKESKDIHMSRVIDGTMYYPQDSVGMRIGGADFYSIRPQQVDNDQFALLVNERIDVGTTYGYNFGTLDDPYTSSEFTDLTFLVNSENTEVDPNDFYFQIDQVIPAERMSQTVTVVESGTGNVTEKTVGVATVTCYYGSKPYADAGFRDVVFGMLSFRVPLIPDLIGNIISGIFLFSMGFVIFGLFVKTAPFLG